MITNPSSWLMGRVGETKIETTTSGMLFILEFFIIIETNSLQLDSVWKPLLLSPTLVVRFSPLLVMMMCGYSSITTLLLISVACTLHRVPLSILTSLLPELVFRRVVFTSLTCFIVRDTPLPPLSTLIHPSSSHQLINADIRISAEFAMVWDFLHTIFSY